MLVQRHLTNQQTPFTIPCLRKTKQGLFDHQSMLTAKYNCKYVQTKVV